MADLAFAITFLDTFTVGLVSPIYPQLVQGDVLGATLFAVLQSTANAAALVASTLFGRLSDVHGRRAALIACTLCTLIGYVCYIAGFAFDGNPRFTVARLWLPSIGRVLSGVGRAALNGLLIALLVEDEADTSSRVSRTMAMCGFGYATGSAFGGFLVGRGGPSANLTLIGTMSVLSVLCTLRLPSSAKPANEGPTPVSSTSHTPSRVRWWSALLDALSEPNMRLLLLLQAIASSSFQVYDATSALYMMDALGYSAAERGFLLGYAGWVFSFFNLAVISRITGRGSNAARLLTLAYACTAVGRLGLAAASVLPPTLTILASYAVLNLGQGLTHTLLKSLTANLASQDRLGLVIGLLGSVEKGCGVAAPLLGGPAYEHVGPVAPACLSAGFAFVGACVAQVASTSATLRRPARAAKKTD